MKKLIKIILFELWLVVACFIIKNGAPWMMQIPLTYLIIAVFALMPFFAFIDKQCFRLKHTANKQIVSHFYSFPYVDHTRCNRYNHVRW
jgi:hypothetical protein